MTIEQSGEIYNLTCDICGMVEAEPFDYFSDAVDFKKENGWKSQKRYGEWEDVCPDCQKLK